MKKPLLLATVLCIMLSQELLSQEVFAVDSINRTLTPAGSRYYLAHPYEILYWKDDSLYITEKVGKVRIVSSTTGLGRIILDHRSSTYVNISYSGGVATGIGQNGMMGMALHKDFKAAVGAQNYVYIAYSYNATSLRISRFTYNTTTWMLGNEVQLINGIPAGGDHSSGRLIYGADDKLYYSCGDLGNNQFGNRCNPIRAQDLPTSAEFTANNYTKYQGKILRLNLDGTVPSDNPLLDPDGAGAQVAVRSHIYSMGHRNPQGLVSEMNPNNGSTFPTLRTSGGRLYSSEHGVRTDDEINIITNGGNYGWPYWSGFRNSPSENYRYINWSSAPATCGSTGYNEVVIPSGATVTLENAYAAGAFIEPIKSMYPACGTFPNCATTLTTGTDWMRFPTIAPSSIDHYGFTAIPGWHNSLLIPTLRRGTIYRFKLNAAGDGVVDDSVSYFYRYDRYRDIAIKNGKIIFAITDSIGSTSGPSGGGTSALTRPGTILKYTFLGYQNNTGNQKSTIPSTIAVSPGTGGSCAQGTPVTIDATNTAYWVPITGPDGNIVAEIKANAGNNLGLVTTTFYKNNSGTVRTSTGVAYADRSITITPAVQPTTPVNIRLYLTTAEFDALNTASTAVSTIMDVKILKNQDACLPAIATKTTLINPTYAEAHGLAGNGYVLQGTINSFSTFYFGPANITLPLDLLTFTGSIQNNNAAVLKWDTDNEQNSSHFVLERSIDARNFEAVTQVAAAGNSSDLIHYSYTDHEVANLPSATVYYRLKMVNIDGSHTYSNTIVVSLADIAGKISIFPNPANHSVKLMVTSATDGSAQWKIADNAGRVVMQSGVQLRKGRNNVDIDINKLSAGIYYVTVTGNGIDQKVKLQKL